MTNRKRAITVLLLIATAAFAVAACGSDDESSSTTASSGGDTSTAASSEGKKLGLLTVVPAEVTSRGQDAIQTASDDLGWDLTVNDPQGDPQKAVTGLSNLVTQGQDAILMAPWESTVVRQPLQQAADADIPVSVVWGQVTPSDLISGDYVTPDRRVRRGVDRVAEDGDARRW